MIERLRAGEVEVVVEVWCRYRPSILAVCRRYLRDEHLAEDAASEAFLRAWEARHRIDPARPLGPWLRTIAARHCISVLRQRSRSVPASDHLDLIDADPLVQPSSVETTVDVHRVLDRLNGRHRRVLLAAARGDSLIQIGRDEELTLQGAKSLVHRARTAFRAMAAGCLGLVSGWRLALHRGSRFDPAMAALLAGALVFPAGGQVVVQPEASRAQVAANPVAVGRRGPSRFVGAAPTSTMQPLRSPTVPAGVQPEQARIVDVEYSPRYAEDGTVFLVGMVPCDACGPVLFRSQDHGRSFVALPAAGFLGEGVALPPSYGPGDRRIFATSRLGLQLSTDEGATFVTVAPVGPLTRTDIAFDPRFGLDQPRIVLGGAALLEFDAALGVVRARYAVPPGRLTPAFTRSGELLVSGLVPDLLSGRDVATLFRCGPLACVRSALEAEPGALPIVTRTGGEVLLHAGGRFATPSEVERIDWRPVPFGGVIAAATIGPLAIVERRNGGESGAALFRLGERGRDRQVPVGPGPAMVTVEASGRTLILGFDPGIRCSIDGGRSWTSRCGGRALEGSAGSSPGTIGATNA